MHTRMEENLQILHSRMLKYMHMRITRQELTMLVHYVEELMMEVIFIMLRRMIYRYMVQEL